MRATPCTKYAYVTARLPVLLALLGCSGPAHDGGGGAGSSGHATNGGATGGGVTSGGSSNSGSSNSGSSNSGSSNSGSSNGGSSNGGSSNGGSSNGGASGSGGQNSGPLTAHDLAPLAVGNRWTYTVTGDKFNCPVGSLSTTVESLAPFAGREAYQVRDFCMPAELIAFSYEGDALLQNFGPTEWHTVMALPIQDGASWIFVDPVTITWHAVPSITVPAGAFNNCFMRTVSQSPNLEATFCPGVGQVRRVDDGYTAVLESYELH